MPVIDELYIRNGTNRVPVDSIDNKAIEEIVINDQIYHFAKESAASGVDRVVCENAVNEPFRSIEATGDTTQQTYTGKNLFDIDNPVYSYNNALNKNYHPRISNGVIESGGISGIATGGVFTINTSNLNYITISFDAEYDATTEKRRVVDGKGATAIGEDKVMIGMAVLLTDSNGVINSGANKYVVNVAAYNYFTIGFISNTKYGIKITNLQIESGQSKTAYEQYVGGKAAPNPDYPQDIINAGDNGLEVEVKSPNVFDIDNALISVNWYYSGGSWAYPLNLTIGKQYTMSLTLKETPSGYSCSLCRKNNMTQWAYERVYNFIGTGKKTTTFIADGRECLWLYKNGGSSFEEFVEPYLTDYLENIQINEGSTVLPYSPYFEPTTLSIPATVGDLELRFAKYNNTSKDSLIVDGVNKKVIYKQMLDSFVAKASNVNPSCYKYKQSTGTKKYCHGVSFSGLLSQKCNRAKGYCSHLKDRIGTQSGNTNELWYGISTNLIYWTGILDYLGFTEEKAANETQYTTAELTEALNKFKAWVTQQAENGTPLHGSYVLPTPIEHDITNTELGDQLLALAANKGTNILEITGATSLDVSYWRQVLPDEEI